MSRLLGLRRKPKCFYCQHVLEKAPVDPNNFQCPSCDSANHFDPKTGEITSSPAMYDAMANSLSFSRRATPSKTAIPTTVEQSVFCRECTINQQLVTNMLANYLPLPEDPNYQALLETLPDYKASLETRYPLVCEQCLPLVEEKLIKKEHMAKSKALGGWMNAKQGTPRRPGLPGKNSSILRQPRERPWQARIWMLQGLLYVVTTLWVLTSYIYGMARLRSPLIRTLNPLFIIISLFWTFWNRTWLQARRKGMRIRGRKESTRIQFLIWASRLVMSSLVSFWGKQVTEGTFGAFLAVEVALGVLAMITLKAEIPPPIALSRHSSTVFKETPLKRRTSLMPSDSFKTPAPKTTKPVFGTPSLVSHMAGTSKADEEMDWAPQISSTRIDDDAFALRPGRLSADPTGLEGLFASTTLVGEPTDMLQRSHSQQKQKSKSDVVSWIQSQDLWVMGGVILTIVILLLGAVLPTWQRQKGALWDPNWEWTHFDTPAAESVPLADWSNVEAEGI
ncbi:hypothetical protein M408DRAFT_11129 [Serendipita vermifera MAFF 305830]|uniref:Ima1 N-terminal domain-containing protein n=1 Tax=Serendipita vermifera MAFF 305830 TaxID=933852 RepID=A0A0C2X456_SERVB|nr:hypothetical protein M408DRAFT_11129 [Serendipita vermifera MAFF 305830]